MDARIQRHDESTMLVTALATDYHGGHVLHWHKHPNAQLIHAISGVMVVSVDNGHWVVPPTRGLWMPPNVRHEVRMVGDVHMRSAFIRPDAAHDLSTECAVVGITALLRELLLEAVDAPFPYPVESRTHRLMALILDEIKIMKVLPLYLPKAADERLQVICGQVLAQPDDKTTLEEWSQRLGTGAKTIQRQFAREFGLTFGQWRQQARLLAGLERLASGVKVLEVALDLGYDSPSAFATMFKRQFGMTPSTFFN